MRPPPFPAKYRASGLLLHVTSLPSGSGIGDLGPAAVAWIDRLHEAGQSWWQALPLGPTGYGDSPYQSLSSFAGNPLLISPDWLRVTTIFPRQGQYARDAKAYRPADLTIERIGDLLTHDLPEILSPEVRR